MWWGAVLVMLAAGIGGAATGLSFDFRSNPTLLLLVAAYAAITFFYRSIRFDERLSQALVAVAQLLLILLFGLLCSYAAAVTATPYRDAELLAIDKWLGFDRTSYLRVFTDSPWKVHLSNFIYLSMLPQLALTPLFLIITNRMEHLQRFVAAYGIALSRGSQYSFSCLRLAHLCISILHRPNTRRCPLTSTLPRGLSTPCALAV